MNKKVLTFGLVVGTICAALLSGCGGSPDDDPNAGGGNVVVDANTSIKSGSGNSVAIVGGPATEEVGKKGGK